MRDVFYVRREGDLMKTAKVNAYIMHIFGKIELLSIHATYNYFKMHYIFPVCDIIQLLTIEALDKM